MPKLSTHGQRMLNNKKSYLPNYKIVTLLIIFASITTNVQAKTQQQNVFLDASGKPIPNDILLSLSTNTKKKATKSKKNKVDAKKSDKKKQKKKKKNEENPELKKELFTAMKAGNVTRVDQLLRARVRPTYKTTKVKHH